MSLKLKLTVAKLLHDPRARAVLILATLLLAALAGAAPSDHSGA
ncbi:MAG: hypothetical protein U0401_05305 [Anaerolineae bacterium]